MKGFFGGSFDPIHNGHLHLALELSERHGIDEVFFCPTSQSPHKRLRLPYASKEHRRAMVTAAIAPFPHFTLLDTELQNTDPCYTIDTIRALIEADGGSTKQYCLFLGEDAAASLPTWKEVDELIQLASPLVGSREKEVAFQFKGCSPVFRQLLKKGWTSIPRLEISSSWVRARIEKEQYAGHLLPGKVWDYIQAHRLYQTLA